MFSFFRKKSSKKHPELPVSQPSTPKNKYTQEYLKDLEKYETNSAEIRALFPRNYPNSKAEMIEFMVQMRLLADEAKIMQGKYQDDEKRKQVESERLHKVFLQNQAIQEEEARKKQAARNRLFNNLTRKRGYKSRNNLLNNAAKQRGVWREKNPNAPYYSLENFIETGLFRPHNKYTGINNANTISLNSPRSIRTRNNNNNNNNFFGGKRTTRRFLRKQ